jgi:hypothetical protein
MLCAVLLLGGMGCATQSVTFTSEPPGAYVRIDNQTLVTPCELDLARGIHSARFSLDSHPDVLIEQEVDVPSLLTLCGSTVGRTGGCVLKGAAMPFLFIGAVGAGMIGGATDPGGLSYQTGQDDYGALIVLAGAAGGFAIGLPLYTAGEYLEEVSFLESPDVHVVLAD